MLTNKREDERDDDVATTTVVVETCEFTNTAIKSTLMMCEEVLDLGNLFAITKGMPLLYDNDDNDDDNDALVVPVATNNLREEKYNMYSCVPIRI